MLLKARSPLAPKNTSASDRGSDMPNCRTTGTRRGDARRAKIRRGFAKIATQVSGAMTARLMKLVLVVCGSLAVALGVIGIFVPLMPTTVFLLLAAACYARSSDRFYQKLINSRWLGSYIRNHREGRGMTRRQKTSTLALLWIGIGVSMIWSVDAWWLRLLLLSIAVGVTVHVARLKVAAPEPLPDTAT